MMGSTRVGGGAVSEESLAIAAGEAIKLELVILGTEDSDGARGSTGWGCSSAGGMGDLSSHRPATRSRPRPVATERFAVHRMWTQGLQALERRKGRRDPSYDLLEELDFN